MEKTQAVDHRHKHRGLIKEVQKVLAKSGCFISPVAVTKRIKSGKNEETMKIYFRLLKRWNRMREREERNKRKAQQLRNQTAGEK
jgi:hypothetical protein